MKLNIINQNLKYRLREEGGYVEKSTVFQEENKRKLTFNNIDDRSCKVFIKENHCLDQNLKKNETHKNSDQKMDWEVSGLESLLIDNKSRNVVINNYFYTNM